MQQITGSTKAGRLFPAVRLLCNFCRDYTISRCRFEYHLLLFTAGAPSHVQHPLHNGQRACHTIQNRYFYVVFNRFISSCKTGAPQYDNIGSVLPDRLPGRANQQFFLASCPLRFWCPDRCEKFFQSVLFHHTAFQISSGGT